MARANRERMPNDSTMAIIHASSFYEQKFGGSSLIQTSPNCSKEIYDQIEEHPKNVNLDPETPEKSCGLVKNFTMSNSSSVSSPSSINSNGLGYNLSEEGHSVINFKPDYVNFSGSLLSFEQSKKVRRSLYPEMIEDEYPLWEDYQSSKCTATITNHVLPESSSGGVQFGWFNDHEEKLSDGVHELGRLEASNNKRPSTGESAQVSKKQCAIPSSSASKKAKTIGNVSPSKDPQSIAAKNRRERISERLKVLQDLVPNGSKVDLVTMLEKAISYVKFLQLQVKVLATDEFWPAPGGKAPDLTQVKDAIDAILASQRDRNSTSI